MSKTARMSVAEFLTLQIESSNKLQSEIAKEVGFEKPNIMTMIKQGKTKLPTRKIGPMAQALGLDPIFLFEFVMREYQPETWDSIDSLFKQPIMNENELVILKAIREAGLPSSKIPDSDCGKIARAITKEIASL